MIFAIIFGWQICRCLAITCVQCRADNLQDLITSGSCLTSPPPPKQCSNELMTSCLVISSYDSSKEESADSPSSIVRTCSSSDLGDDCRRSHTKDNDQPAIEVCHKSCFTDGCNSSNFIHFQPYDLFYFCFILLLINSFLRKI